MKVVLLDELYNNSNYDLLNPSADDLILTIETKILREVKDIITIEGLEKAYKFIEKYPNQVLWKLLANVRKFTNKK